MKLLVVDYEKMIRQMIAKYAVCEGYEVAEAENGMQAVEMARAGGYSLVIMDIMMPELDGFSAAREIRKTSDVPIIFLSARGEEYDKIHGFELGVDDYVVKPFSPRELMMRVGAVLRRAQPSGAGNVHETVTVENMVVDFTARREGDEQKVACFNLTQTVRGIMTRYAKLTEQDGYHIVFEPQEEAWVNADEVQAQQLSLIHI